VALDEVLKSLGVTQWDVAIVGDGSGTAWGEPCGWSSILHERKSSLRKCFNGGFSHGTNNLAELIPYLQAMLWYANGPGKKRLHDLRMLDHNKVLTIHIVTDSEITAKQGNGEYNRKANREIWAAIDSFCDRGYRFYWHWLGRSKTGLNILADYLAGNSRLAMREASAKSAKAMSSVGVPPGYSVYDFNHGGQENDPVDNFQRSTLHRQDISTDGNGAGSL
jgi:ribonuclease HI